MKMKTLLTRICLSLSIFFFYCAPIKAATPMETLKEMFESGVYTIKYEVQNDELQDMQRRFSHDTLFDKTLELEEAGNRNSKDFLTVQGQIAYGEHIQSFGGQKNGICYLQKEDKVYEFMYNNGKYFSRTAGKFVAPRPMSERKKAELYGYSFLNALKPIMPEKFRSKDDIYYTFRLAGQGTDKDGRTYYDYEADFSRKDDSSYLVYRYMFEGNTLVKIAMASHFVSQGKEHNGREIIYIKEISPTAETSRLALPTGLTALD